MTYSDGLTPWSPDKNEVGQDKHAIVLWRLGLLWTFVETFGDEYDAIVSEEWMRTLYSTSDIQRQVMLEVIAREIGLSDETGSLETD